MIPLKDIIKDSFNKHKIAQMQLDPNGHCNAGCWFCPVAYQGNPEHAKKPMPIPLLRKIIENIVAERDREDGLVDKNFGGFYTSHYNELLLYPYLREFFEILREFKMRTMILSNGTTLTPNKADLLAEFSDVISGVNLNIPIFTSKELWAKRVNLREGMFDNMIRNVHYAMEKLPNFVQNKAFSIGINGINSNSLYTKGGWITLGPDFDTLDIDMDPVTGEHAQQVAKAKELFPGMQIYGMPSLIDRAGLLDNVISNKDAIEGHLMRKNKDKRVIGCGNGIEVGGRPVGWLHINALGDAFLCCNDYDMEIVVGNLERQEIRDFWGNDKHIEMIEKSYNTICRNCASAKFEE
jgi:MoaA/NifB/PqqE/SkfB family radical SAM enzyme